MTKGPTGPFVVAIKQSVMMSVIGGLLLLFAAAGLAFGGLAVFLAMAGLAVLLLGLVAAFGSGGEIR